MEHPEYSLSEAKRIAFVHDQLILWLLNSKIELYELKRAIAMELRLQDDRRIEKALERRH